MLDTLRKDLEMIGFQEKEARVYLASLELGQATVQQIAQKAEVKRPTAYFVIEGLMSQGLVTSFYQGKKQYFVAETPDRLSDIIEQERQEVTQRVDRFKTILPQLQSINNRQKDKPVVKYYEGKEGIISMVKEYLSMSQGQEVNLAYSRDVIKDTFDEETLLEFSKSRVSHHVKARSIYTWSDGELSDSTYTENVKLSEQEFPITCDIAIYDDKVRIASLKNRIVGVVIEDKEIAQSLRAIFNLAWKGLSQEKKINKDVLK